MLFKLVEPSKTATGILLSLILLLGGCAQREWRDSLAEAEDEKAQQLLAMKMDEQNLCSCCLDAEIQTTWQSRMADGGLNGYIQLMHPSTLKLVAINPLGQPLFVFTTDGQRFQAVNVQDGLFKYGKVASFVKKHSVPENVFHGEYAKWLRGTITRDDEKIGELYQDTTSRGFWVRTTNTSGSRFPDEYLLLDQVTGKLLERVAIDRDGNEAARVIYKNWTRQNGCPIPTSLEIRSPSYGTAIQLDLKDIKIDKTLSSKDFDLKPPRGFLQQFYP
ncbi:MAG: hypothetical protein QNJ17_06310 [Desulfocapsaceae bacterium]|nr:hypothetical protein [Desulfocapsaceae bacterium]